jgi:hypothetical protein
VQAERGPGFAERQITSSRPAGSISRSTTIQRGVGGFAPGVRRGGPGWGPGWGWGPRPVIVNSGVPLGPAIIGGAGLFGLGMLAGSAATAPPPPPPVVVVNPAPAVVAGPAPVVAAPAPTIMVDEVALAAERLKSWHEPSRREACYVLGRLHDPRALPYLLERLKNDWSKEVRVAAAFAVGEIGDPRAIVPLQRVAVYDKRQEVRDTAEASVRQIQQVQAQLAQQSGAVQAPPSQPPQQPAQVSSRPAQTPAFVPERRTTHELAPLPDEASSDTPPPPPTPSVPGSR